MEISLSGWYIHYSIRFQDSDIVLHFHIYLYNEDFKRASSAFLVYNYIKGRTHVLKGVVA
ncbi:hypothetical protein ACFPFV_01885 [Salinicoccus siamensis]|uniref:hypothetical protein n=1 Tax=Salinicoccus siamensis TaxID=381830 RepID=UPI00360B221F